MHAIMIMAEIMHARQVAKKSQFDAETFKYARLFSLYKMRRLGWLYLE